MVASVAVVVWRVERTTLAIAARFLAVREKSVDAEVAVKGPGKQTPPIPQDLQMFAHRESESWAIEATEAALRDAYAEMGDWDKVRNQVMQ